jgi:hypothetical protein
VDKNGKEVTIGETKAMKGGEGSGNFGHAGRPGEVGGSAAGGGGALGKVQDIYRGDLSGVTIQYGENERGAGGFVGERESIFVNPSQSFMTAEEEKDGIRSRIQRYEDKLKNTDLSDEERRNFTDKLNEYKDKLDNYIPYTLPESENEIVIHELGHVIYAQVEMGEIDGVTDLLPPSKNPTPYSETMMNNFVSMRNAYPVSEYGNKNFDEYFSESFVLYVREDYDKIHPDLLNLFRRISK